MKKILLLAAVFTATLVSCDINKKGDVELPEIEMDVDVEEGNLPEFDVDWADVNVGTKTKTVSVPKVRIVMEEEEVEVPYIDVDMPNEDKEELSIAVEAEVMTKEHEITIREIRANDRRLYVISTLEKMDTDLGDETMRVQDQIELNAPDLDVKHIIVGEKPNRSFNNRYQYVSNMNDLPETVQKAKIIYSKK